MNLEKTYSPESVEEKWYTYWEEQKFFRSVPDERESFTIVIPPPNVTGVLHMGHMLNNTIQDVLIRRARMRGYNACWVPGTDHASIATEAKVVNMLAEKGIKKEDIGREEFLKHAYEWTDKYGGIIFKQLRKLGASCDWDRERFTLEPKLSEYVIKTFVDLHNKGLIYQGLRMTNWDPAAQTALSDEEVYYKEVNSKLYHIRYQIEGTEDEWITIATTRPETILGDTAICVHPEDERYKDMKGKKAIVPLINRAIPIIYDEYVEMEFGTGALKVTPAHDLNDYELGKKHNLENIDILNADATMSPAAQLYVGEDRFKVRKKIAKDLEASGNLVEAEDYSNKVGYSERTHVVIEPRQTKQWFLKMKGLADPALKNVLDDTIQFFPPHYKNLYRHWMENIRDWCISRQLWWGQQIPAYYLPNGEYVVAETAEEALKLAQEKSANPALTLADLRQDEDVVDTWFSSWLWPISVFNGFDDQSELDYYYPTNVLVTGWDIIFFWVARMVMAGYEFKGERPFHSVYFTGMVRDKQGRKMSKSLGNSPDPLGLIEQFGADGVRMGLLFSSPAGGDLLFEDKLCEQGRNFNNKIWNALRLMKGFEITEGKNEDNEPAIQWFENKLSQVIEETDKMYETYRLSEIIKTLYSFVWNDFCSAYLEMTKPDFGSPIDQYTYDKTIEFFEALMKLLHPFMPFITEEVYHLMKERADKDSIMMSDYPKAADYDQLAIDKGEFAKSIITKVRDIRNQAGLKQRDMMKLYFQSETPAYYDSFKNIIQKKAFLECFDHTTEDKPNTVSFIINQDNFFIDTGAEIDVAKEAEKLRKEIEYTLGFIKSVNKKLGNERFVNNAPEAVVNSERKKLADAEEKLAIFQDNLSKLEV